MFFFLIFIYVYNIIIFINEREGIKVIFFLFFMYSKCLIVYYIIEWKKEYYDINDILLLLRMNVIGFLNR